jgi:hypothetical protein
MPLQRTNARHKGVFAQRQAPSYYGPSIAPVPIGKLMVLKASTIGLGGLLCARLSPWGGERGLGIVYTKQMNMCLMVKWLWKLHVHEEGLWVHIIKNKYLRSNDLPIDNHRPEAHISETTLV